MLVLGGAELDVFARAVRNVMELANPRRFLVCRTSAARFPGLVVCTFLFRFLDCRDHFLRTRDILGYFRLREYSQGAEEVTGANP
jgi:hypothetical protein